MNEDEKMAKAAELSRKMEKDMDDWIEEMSQRPERESQFKDKSADEIWAELKQHPAFMTEFDPSKPMSPEMEGLMQLKYESGEGVANAEAYKDDGNEQFKKKKYRWAIENYTKGLEKKCVDKELNAILYCNRAAANFHLGNYRSSLNDAIFSRKFKPTHMKAIIRGAECCIELKRFADGLKWCDDGLMLVPKDTKFLNLRAKADQLMRQHERDKRKSQAQERKKRQADQALIRVILERGVTVGGMKHVDLADPDPEVLSCLETHRPSGDRVHLDENGELQWPVLLLYPEYGQSDYIQAFSDADNFDLHIVHIFGTDMEPAPWDEQRNYIPRNIEVYYEDKKKGRLHKVDTSTTLGDVLKQKSYMVHGGTPGFFLLVKDSVFAKDFLSKYD